MSSCKRSFVRNCAARLKNWASSARLCLVLLPHLLSLPPLWQRITDQFHHRPTPTCKTSPPLTVTASWTGWAGSWADFRFRWDATQTQENAVARKVIAFAWVQGIAFRTGHAGVSSAPRIQAGKTVLLMHRFLSSMRVDFGGREGQAILSVRRSSTVGAGHWWMGAAFCSNPPLRVSNPVQNCVVGDDRVPMQLGRVVQSVPYNDSHKSQKAYCAVSSSPLTRYRSRLCQTSSRLPPRPISSSKRRASDMSTSSRHAESFMASNYSVEGARASIPEAWKTIGPLLMPTK